MTKLIEKARRMAAEDARARRDTRYRTVIGFLAAKGLLLTDQVPAAGGATLRVRDVEWVAEQLEPRVFEVLPAAILRFPKAFPDAIAGRLPADLERVVRALRRGDESGPDFRGAPYEQLRRWANLPLRDKRAKPLSQRRILKTFRFHPETVRMLRESAEKRGITETELLESLVATHGDGGDSR